MPMRCDVPSNGWAHSVESVDVTGYSGYMQSGGMLMTSPEGTRWRFDAGTLFLEFMLTGGPGRIARFDSLHQPVDFTRWARECRLGLDPPSIESTPEDITTARSLRDALWRITWALMSGEAAHPADLLVLNNSAAVPPLAPQMGTDLRARWELPVDTLAILSTVARDAIEVLSGTAAARIRECEAGDCQLVFLDTSRPGSRRWCSMERCGNRHKVRALRSRRSTLISPTSGDHEGE